MKNVLFNIAIILFVVSCNSELSNTSMNSQAQGNAKSPIDYKVDSLVAIMTLEEKVGQMNQYNGFWNVTGPTPQDGDAAKKYEDLRNGRVGSMLNVRGVEEVRAVQKVAVEESRLGIPLIIGFDVIHGYKTLSPIPIAESASWDMEAIQTSAQMAAREASAAGINWTFAPMVDISRDARWGRVMEGGGEDPYLGSHIAKARVRGFQGDDLSSANTIAACAKHFAAYGFAESGRDYNTVDIGTSTLYNVVLPPFKATVDANVATFMNSFNELNGVPATGDTFLQRDILKDKWGFDGFVVSDWGSIKEMIDHGYAKDLKDAARLGAIAGSDMDMESYAYVDKLVSLVNEGKVDEKLIDDSVRRILKTKYELGLFDDPYKYCDEAREKAITGSTAMNEAALDMAKKSIVLLKNELGLLPLKKEGQKIAVIGALANDKTSPLGSWRIAAEDETAVSVLEGLNKYPKNTYTFAKGVDVTTGRTDFVYELDINTTDRSEIPAAVDVAKAADVVIMVLGEHGFQSGEARSRSQLDLPGLQQELLEAVYAKNKNIVLVLNNGRPLALPWAAKHIPAIIEAWQLGTQSGNAIAQVIYGDYNPSGKLPMTFPRSLGQVPIYYNYKNTGRPNKQDDRIVFWSHYSDVENTPLYPFGHGLSYTTFNYENLSVDNTYTTNGKVTVKVDLKNTGTVKGKEVVQLYIRDKFASVTRPVRELKGFELIELAPKATKTVSFELTKDELGFFNNQGEFVIEPGEFEIFVGGSSITSVSESITIE